MAGGELELQAATQGDPQRKTRGVGNAIMRGIIYAVLGAFALLPWYIFLQGFESIADSVTSLVLFLAFSFAWSAFAIGSMVAMGKQAHLRKKAVAAFQQEAACGKIIPISGIGTNVPGGFVSLEPHYRFGGQVLNGSVAIVILLFFGGGFAASGALANIFTMLVTATVVAIGSVVVHRLLLLTMVGRTEAAISHNPLRPSDDFELIISQAGTFTINKCDVNLTYHMYDRKIENAWVKDLRVIPLATAKNLKARNGKPILHIKACIPDTAAASESDYGSASAWTIRITMDLPGRPNITQEFPITITP